MFAVYFYDKKDVVLVQCRSQVPTEGEALTVKGRKGKVSRVEETDQKFHVYLELEPERKNNVALDPAKKKKR